MSVVVVAGAVANKPLNAGGAWSRLTILRGLLRLGVDAWFVEEIAPATCVDAAGRQVPLAESVNLAFFRRATEQLEVSGRASLVGADGGEAAGAAPAELEALADSADLLLNVSGHLRLPSLRRRFRRSAFLDVDPGFTQYWAAAGNGGARLEGHDLYFTIGERIGSDDCPIPTCGLDWKHTRPLVVLDDWPVVANGNDRFTTVSTWRGPYGPVEAEGRRFDGKLHAFRRFVELPRRAGQSFELALDIHPDDGSDRELLERNGWRVVDAHEAVPDPEAFRRYVQRSAAEFSVAQGVYAETRSGWFSDRTARYLASGKPALVQDTGFPPSNAGLLGFRHVAEAVAGARRIARDYDEHAQAARALAAERFDAERVLGRLLEEAGVRP